MKQRSKRCHERRTVTGANAGWPKKRKRQSCRPLQQRHPEKARTRRPHKRRSELPNELAPRSPNPNQNRRRPTNALRRQLNRSKQESQYRLTDASTSTNESDLVELYLTSGTHTFQPAETTTEIPGSPNTTHRDRSQGEDLPKCVEHRDKLTLILRHGTYRESASQ